MATFKGNARQFERFIGPFVRNIVQQLSKRRKRAIKACEHCGETGLLEAAHRKGFGRRDIIFDLLSVSDLQSDFEVDIVEFELKLKEAHTPIENVVLILCGECHKKYDAPENASEALADAITKGSDMKQSVDDILPISLDPASHEEFKERLLSSRRAIIEVLYSDGSIKQRSWEATRFSETSNVYGNLRSRPEFRKGIWQELGISKVNVRIAE